MPSFTGDAVGQPATTSATSSFDHLPRKSHDKSLSGVFAVTNGGPDSGYGDHRSDHFRAALKNHNLHNLPNGTPNGSLHGRERSHSKAGSVQSVSSGKGRFSDTGRRSPAGEPSVSRSSGTDQFPSSTHGGAQHTPRPSGSSLKVITNGDQTSPVQSPASDLSQNPTSTVRPHSPEYVREPIDYLNASPARNRHSTPPTTASPQHVTPVSSATNTLPRLSHRHTLQVPRISTQRTSREFSFSNNGLSEEALSVTGRFSPTHPSHRRSSLGLVRRTTRSIASDLHLDEVPQDEDAIRWTEAIRQKRASKRRKKDDDDEDRVVVGTKVDQGHVNWVTAYNMLTGIRFTVSRTNAKMDRELTDADFVAKHKFSFDITGNELTPSAKYDFKFKDYAPWVFRHLRAIFGLDPADYLMSLTSKYILSELGSPGKSGSFFYFSRDYKYIIKTIHHAEHKLLRKILKDYYNHIRNNPNTLISQFYGLHRVKIPYGRKIHFVIMNNLFPPHRDIHEMFDLKGSTIGREFKEEMLEKSPRATLKDLNWLRRNRHLEFGPSKKEIFIKQMERDVALLQRLKIMDYSLLVGVHDVGKGNEEKVRDKTLRVFQPGGEQQSEASAQLMRTPSRMETMRKAHELRKTLKREKPVPMEMVQAKMPEEMLDDRKDKVFYSDDGGFRATHDDGREGDEIYYLGIIDCLTKYGFVKKAEHFWKGMSANSSQISPIPPQGYGERFINFITGVTMTREEANRQSLRSRPQSHSQSIDVAGPSVYIGSSETNRSSGDAEMRERMKSPADKTIEKAQKQVRKYEREGNYEEEIPERVLGTAKSPSGQSPVDRSNGGGSGGGTIGAASMTLPIVEEKDNEAGSTGGRSGVSGKSMSQLDLPRQGYDATPDGLPNGVPGNYANATTIDDGDGDGDAFCDSPIDDERALDRGRYKPGTKKRYQNGSGNGSAMLPDIPRLAPMLTESPMALEPEKPEAEMANGRNGRRKRSPLGRWGTA